MVISLVRYCSPLSLFLSRRLPPSPRPHSKFLPHIFTCELKPLLPFTLRFATVECPFRDPPLHRFSLNQRHLSYAIRVRSHSQCPLSYRSQPPCPTVPGFLHVSLDEASVSFPSPLLLLRDHLSDPVFRTSESFNGSPIPPLLSGLGP